MNPKTKILMVQTSLSAGGAEKAMVSLLNTLPAEKYDIDLMLVSRSGLFYPQVPDWVKIIDAPLAFQCLSHKISDWRYYLRHPVLWFKKLKRTWTARHQHDIHFKQCLWQQWSVDIPVMSNAYDVAYGGQEGACNYFVAEKVQAEQKILWIHNDYDKLGYSPAWDRAFFRKATVIATMSPEAQAVLQRNFPECHDRIWFLENISNGRLIHQLSEEPVVDVPFFTDSDGIRILSMGRLSPQKNFTRAVHAASILKKKGIPFCWIVIGEGFERSKLELLVRQLDLEDHMRFIGMRSNPYPYLAQADMLVVSSDFEGRSIAIDESQILGIPVITTNYATAPDAVINNETGIICDMSAHHIASSIQLLHDDKALYLKIKSALQTRKDGNISELQKYELAFEGNGGKTHPGPPYREGGQSCLLVGA